MKLLFLCSILLILLSCATAEEMAMKQQRVLVAHQGQMNRCYLKSPHGANKEDITVLLDFDIDEFGTTNDVVVYSKQEMASELKECLSELIKNMKFPYPPNNRFYKLRGLKLNFKKQVPNRRDGTLLDA